MSEPRWIETELGTFPAVRATYRGYTLTVGRFAWMVWRNGVEIAKGTVVNEYAARDAAIAAADKHAESKEEAP